MARILSGWLILFMLTGGLSADESPRAAAASAVSPVFTLGEVLTYEIKWDPPRWMIFLPATYTAGTLTLRMDEHGLWQGEPAYKLIADAQSSGILPKIARITVQNHFESWIDAESRCLRRSFKQLREGKRAREVEVRFHSEDRTAHLREMDRSVHPPQERKNKTLSNLPPCVQDLISAIYVSRLNRFALNDAYPVDILDEDRIKTIQLRVQKKEYIRVNSVLAPAVRVQTVALFGGLFASSGELIIWLSDDERRIPLKFDAKVKYGRVHGFLKARK